MPFADALGSEEKCACFDAIRSVDLVRSVDLIRSVDLADHDCRQVI